MTVAVMKDWWVVEVDGTVKETTGFATKEDDTIWHFPELLGVGTVGVDTFEMPLEAIHCAQKILAEKQWYIDEHQRLLRKLAKSVNVTI